MSSLSLDWLEDYDVSLESGFTRPKSASAHTNFSNPLFQPWSDIASQIPTLLARSSEIFRSSVESMPLLELPEDTCMAEWRLSYVLLVHIANAYVWGAPIDDAGGRLVKNQLPACISVPLRTATKKLDIIPGLTYSVGALWNHRFRDGMFCYFSFMNH